MVSTQACLTNRLLTSVSVSVTMAVAEMSGHQIAIFNGFVVESGQRIDVTDEAASAGRWSRFWLQSG